MKLLRHVIYQVILTLTFYSSAFALPDSGFFLPDSVNEMTFRYRAMKNMIVLPVVINDSITVNLILDTGCRNLVLFGKRFMKLFQLKTDRRVEFSGLGSGAPVRGFLSISNTVVIHQVLGEKIPIIVVPNRNVLSRYSNIDGVIGYEIFFKFEIEINAREGTITFRPAMRAIANPNYASVPLRIVDCRPVISSEIQLGPTSSKKCDLMIDTGSSIGLLLKTTSLEEFVYSDVKSIIGLGFNGVITGYKTISQRLILEGFEMDNLPTGIIESPWHNHGSIGMEVLKDYIVVINYYKSYACFKLVT